jgi:hypothetical protein
MSNQNWWGWKNRNNLQQTPVYNNLNAIIVIPQAPLPDPSIAVPLAFPAVELVCRTPTEALMQQYGIPKFSVKNRSYWFKDNNASILAVAHLDTVVPNGYQVSATPVIYTKLTAKDATSESWLFNPYLDDRLGVYTLLHVLPAMGINVDWLFTEDEEKGQSTAKLFTTEKKYNWMVSFDRAGSDVVTYQYDTPEWQKVLEEHHFQVKYGSYSDIRELEDLGCSGVNIGTGLRNGHDIYAAFSVKEYQYQLRRFFLFWQTQREKRHAHVKRTFAAGYNFNTCQSYFDGYSEDDNWGIPKYKKASLIRSAGGSKQKVSAETQSKNWPIYCPGCQTVLKKKQTCPTCGQYRAKSRTRFVVVN